MKRFRFTSVIIAAVAIIISLASCGGSAAEADKAAAEYYAEKFKKWETDRLLNGEIEHWEAMEESRRAGVEGKVMTVTLGFYHEKEPDRPIGKYFVILNPGDEWKVVSMSGGIFIPKEYREEAIKDIESIFGKHERQTNFGPQEKAVLDFWKEEFAGNIDSNGREITDPEKAASIADGYREKYGDYVDCLIEKGSQSWESEDGGQVRLHIFHEKNDLTVSKHIEQAEDGSWQVRL